MNKPIFRVVGLDQATCDSEYCGTETTTKPNAIGVLNAELTEWQKTDPATVSIRLGDMLTTLPGSSSDRLAWVNDFVDDPVVITKDLYDVLLTYQRYKNAA